jgi:exo-beta-1,3-glucanase (GH17 family)
LRGRGALGIAVVAGCAAAPCRGVQPAGVADPSPPPVETATGATSPVATAPDAPFVRRAFAPTRAGAPVREGIAYGPFRAGQRPGGPIPSRDEIHEDLRLIAADWAMIRLYSSAPPAGDILEVIGEHELPIQVLVGAWIAGEPTADAAEVQGAIALARAHLGLVAGVIVGNETQVEWSAHRSSRPALIGHLRAARAGVAQPVTTADDYNFWNKPEAAEVAAEVDFLLLHAYAMWNGKALDEAVAWTAGVRDDIASRHPGLPIVLGELGWATTLNPEGSEVEHIRAPAGEAEQARFYRELRAWSARDGQPYFWFEAFDEPWKGGADPRDVEKHWGLYRVDRTPKPALAEAPR